MVANQWLYNAKETWWKVTWCQIEFLDRIPQFLQTRIQFNPVHTEPWLDNQVYIFEAGNFQIIKTGYLLNVCLVILWSIIPFSYENRRCSSSILYMDSGQYCIKSDNCLLFVRIIFVWFTQFFCAVCAKSSFLFIFKVSVVKCVQVVCFCNALAVFDCLIFFVWFIFSSVCVPENPSNIWR